jgi:Na+/melibiose symporter-like transporter
MNRKNMGYTIEDAIKTEIDNLYQRNSQLLTIRWQAVGIAITLISAFWIFALPEIFDKEQQLGIIYLLLFCCIFFSIIMLLVWRYIANVLTEEELEYWHYLFVYQTLLKKYSGLREDQLNEREKQIKNYDLKIFQIRESLKGEFDKRFDYLNNRQLKNLSEAKIYSKCYEIGHWRFDLYAFLLIGCLYIAGLYFFYKTSVTHVCHSALFNLFQTYYIAVVVFVVIILLPIRCYIKKYLIPNFKRPISKGRRKYIEGIINDDSQNVGYFEYFRSDNDSIIQVIFWLFFGIIVATFVPESWYKNLL